MRGLLGSSSLVYDLEYVETEKVHFARKIPFLELGRKKRRNICISDDGKSGKSGNAPKRQDAGEKKPYQVNQ